MTICGSIPALTRADACRKALGSEMIGQNDPHRTMTAAFDLLIRRARLRSGATRDIAVADGRIASIAEHVCGGATTEIEAGGRLVTESFVNPHLHLCKVWTLAMMDDAAMQAYHGDGMARAASAIDLAARVKAKYHESWITPNARRAIALAALHGNLHVRAFADVDSKARLEGVKALLRVREEF